MNYCDSILSFGITIEQAKKICNYYGKDINQLQGYEICKLLDKLIDSIVDTGEIAPLNF